MSKLFIGIGDSFTQGQGSVSEKTYAEYGREVYNSTHRLPIDTLERENSWVNVVCKKHLSGYTPINLGEKGRGNRAAVKELYLNNLDSESEKIVVFALSGMERFDFPQPGKNFESHHFYAMFPNPWDKNATHASLWKAYSEHVYSEQFCVIETMLNIMEAQTWCKANNAKLLVVSAFDMRVTQKYFIENLPGSKKDLVNEIEWENFIEPRGYRTLMHMLIDAQEEDAELSFDLAHGGYFDRYNKLERADRFLTPCCHPSELGHQLIADVIYENLVEMNYV
jgi:hypothetical protein